jgi:hypothetical protein
MQLLLSSQCGPPGWKLCLSSSLEKILFCCFASWILQTSGREYRSLTFEAHLR